MFCTWQHEFENWFHTSVKKNAKRILKCSCTHVAMRLIPNQQDPNVLADL